jgi:hypothetical protein
MAHALGLSPAALYGQLYEVTDSEASLRAMLDTS